jgi:hypothetical protein
MLRRAKTLFGSWNAALLAAAEQPGVANSLFRKGRTASLVIFAIASVAIFVRPRD